MYTFTPTFVHVLSILVLISRNVAVFGHTLQKTQANKSDATKEIYSDVSKFEEHKNKALLENSENHDKGDFHLRKERSLVADTGYGSRLDAGLNVANDHFQSALFAEIGKRTIDRPENGLPYEKRFISDYGFGSRLSAGESIASDWDKQRLYGMYGPGKRSSENDDSYREMLNSMRPEVDKRILADYGYGSRVQTAENLARTNNVLFGIHGPGKRSLGFVPDERFERYVRKTSPGMGGDSGYGSRVSAGSQLADDCVSMSGIFGLHGPGKRSEEMDETDEEDSNSYHEIDARYENIIPEEKRTHLKDLGYGSRVSTAARLARSNAMSEHYGPGGPGQ